jgi:hypothetical protein
MKNLLLALVLVSTCSFLSAQKVSLQYNLKAGNVFKLNQNVLQNIHQDINGMSMDIKMTMTAQTVYTVDKVENSNYYLTISYESLAMKMESMMMNMSYDSKDTASQNNPLQAGLSAVVGSKFNAVMDNKGKVLSVSGYDAIVKKITDKMAGDDQKLQQATSLVNQQFSDENMKSSIETMTAIFPENPVAIGESWTVKILTRSTMEIANECTYTLKEADAGKWVLEGANKLSTNGEQAVATNGMNAHFLLSGDGKQNIILNSSTGWMVEAKQHSVIDGKVSIEGGQLPAAMEVPMKIEMDVQATSL